MKRGESMRSRGYTLIEIAGVLVVCGILLGASLLPLNRQLRESEYRQERAQMERLRDAVVGYALRHRTPGVEIIMVNDDGTQERGFYAPGRPYLPCADFNGDGIEDRFDLINPVTQTLTRSFKDGTPRAREVSRQLFELFNMGIFGTVTAQGFPSVPAFIGNSPIVYSGTCSASKGQLPWRTLGSIPADYWGNNYTYFADPVFSQEAIGFDEKTIADSGLRFLPRELTTLSVYIPQKRNNNLRTGAGGRVLLGRPSVICDIAKAAKDDLDCGREDGTVVAPATLIAGEPAPTDGDGVFLKPGDTADGLPFVIVSHGYNGFGAYNHLNARRRASNEDLMCNSFGGANAQERINLYVFIPLVFDPFSDSGIRVDECNIGRDGANILNFDLRFEPSLADREEGYFFANRSIAASARAASSFSDQTGLDDLLVWMTRGDLAQRMSEAGIFPLIVNDSDRPPIFYEPL